MGDSMTEKLREAAEGLILNDAQKHILAYRLSRKIKTRPPGSITVSELLGMIDNAMGDMTSGLEMVVVPEDSYRESAVVQQV